LAQIFPKTSNLFPFVAGAVAPVLGLLAVAGVWYYGSPKYTDVGYRPAQPVEYSHAKHAGELKIDCRYCHAQVEVSPVASIPPTQVCINCHSVVLRDSPLLEPIRESAATGQPMRWVRVHNLPDYSYFDHSVHIRAGVGCASCHGKINEMEVVWQAEPLSMGWCLDCHRNPAPHLRPAEEITNMEWSPSKDQAEFAARVIAEKGLAPPEKCAGCHR